MLRPKTAGKHDAANADAAARILRNRHAEPLVMVQWAETFQKRQRAERAQRSESASAVRGIVPLQIQQQQHVDSASTAVLIQQSLPLEAVTHPNNRRGERQQ